MVNSGDPILSSWDKNTKQIQPNNDSLTLFLLQICTWVRVHACAHTHTHKPYILSKKKKETKINKEEITSQFLKLL